MQDYLICFNFFFKEHTLIRRAEQCLHRARHSARLSLTEKRTTQDKETTVVIFFTFRILVLSLIF